MKKDLYVCFIDYTKAFDRVRHSSLIDILQDLNIDGKDIRIVRNLYWNQEAAVRYENEYSQFCSIRRGVRQGCVFSPDLFNLYSESIIRNIQDIKGVIVGGFNINNLRYADDIVLIADSREKLQEMVDTIHMHSEAKGLSINLKKTECMTISKKNNPPACLIRIGTHEIRQVESFIYLGTLINQDGRCDNEILRRIAMAKDAYSKMSKLFKNHKISLGTKKRLLKCYIRPILLYGSECWTISTKMRAGL